MSEDKITSVPDQENTQPGSDEQKPAATTQQEVKSEETPEENMEEELAPVEEKKAAAPKPRRNTEETYRMPKLSPDNVKKWYVIRAISGKEKKVKQYIENEISRIKAQDYVSQVLIPTEKIYQIKNGKKVSKERNTMPGYVLIEAVLVGEIPHIIQNINGVINFLGPKGGLPEPVRMSEVNRILGKMDEMADTEEKLSVPFIIGESVKVIDGPFNGFSGVIEEINEEKRKLKVMVKIFGRKTPLELSYMQVEKE